MCTWVVGKLSRSEQIAPIDLGEVDRIQKLGPIPFANLQDGETNPLKLERVRIREKR